MLIMFFLICKAWLIMLPSKEGCVDFCGSFSETTPANKHNIMIIINLFVYYTE